MGDGRSSDRALYSLEKSLPDEGAFGRACCYGALF